MKCSNDQTEMEKGFLQSSLLWQEGENNTPGVHEKVHAYKCPKCGKIELTAKEEK